MSKNHLNVFVPRTMGGRGRLKYTPYNTLKKSLRHQYDLTRLMTPMGSADYVRNYKYCSADTSQQADRAGCQCRRAEQVVRKVAGRKN